MDEPDAPRMMPVAGWYLDPEIANTWRYWDGAHWTDHRAPAGHLPTTDPHSFSAWFDQSLKTVGAVLWPVGVAVAVTWIVAVVPFLVVASWAFDTDEATEIETLLETDADGVIELTDDELDRVFELLGDLAWRLVPSLVAVALVAALLAAWAYALAVLAASDVRARAGGEARRSFGALAGAAIRRMPAVVASFVVLTAVFVGVSGALFVPTGLAIVFDAGGPAIAVTAVFASIAAFVLLAVLGVRLSLAPIVAARGGHRLGLGRSWSLTDGRFWGVLGRGLVASLIAGAAGGILSFGVGFAAAFGVTAFVAANVVVQAVGSALNTLIVPPSQVVLTEHLEERELGSDGVRR